jgi:DNA end-binding protein Ku
MAGAASWKGAVKLGLVMQFPVRARSAVKEVKFGFNMHHRACGGRLSMGDYICAIDGELIERGSDQIIKGYDGYVGEQLDDGTYPGVDQDYIKSLEQEKSVLLEIDSVVPAASIDPRWFQKSYDLVPEKGGERAYVLIAKALEKVERYAMGRLSMSGKEFVVVVRPRNGALAMEALYWPDEIKSDADVQAMVEGVEVTPKELDMGVKFLRTMAGDFIPEELTNDYANNLAAYLEQFKSGAAPVAAPQIRKAAPATIGSLEDMLAASLAAAEEAKVAKKPVKKAKAA